MLSLDEWPPLRDKTKRYPEALPARAPNEREIEHQVRATRALEYLRSRNIHFTYALYCGASFVAGLQLDDDQASISTGTYSFTYPPPHALTLEIPFTVPQRSNLRVDGARHWKPPYTAPEDDPNGPRVQGSEPVSNGLGVLLYLSPLYGGIHLVAWNTVFPTTVELWIWRAGGIVMVCTPFAVGLCTARPFSLSRWFRETRRRLEDEGVDENDDAAGNDDSSAPGITNSKSKRKITGTGTTLLPLKRFRRLTFRWVLRLVEWVCEVVFAVMFMIITWATFCYPFARLFALGECFAQLRKVDADVYRTVEWAGFVPHVG
jgi:hypothetical protein